MRLAVTGAAGFIGRHLTRTLLEDGRGTVLAIDRKSCWPRLESLDVELATPQDFLGHVESGDVDVVFHQGAISNTMTSDWARLFASNWTYSRRLLRACSRSGTRLIYASSAAVYGLGEHGFREDVACEAPLNVYGLSKQLFDLDVRLHLRNADRQVVGLRYFNVYGSGEEHKGTMASMVHQLEHQARTAGIMKLFEGSKDFQRDFVSVVDVVKVNLFFLDQPQTYGIFNVGTGNATRFTDLARVIIKRHPQARIEYIPFPSKLRGRYQRFTQANLERLHAVGYREPWRSLKESAVRLDASW